MNTPSFKPVENAIIKWANSEENRRALASVQDKNGAIRRRKVTPKLIQESADNLTTFVRESWDFLLNCKIVTEGPRVLKTLGGKFGENEVATVGRLHVVLPAKVVCGDASFDVVGEDFFDRWEYHWDDDCNPTTKRSGLKVGLHIGFSSTQSYRFNDDDNVGRAFNRQLAERLDELNAEWRAAWAKAKTEAAQAVEEHTQKRAGKEAEKFRDKLRKFLVNIPGLLDINPTIMLECMKIDPDDMVELSKFLRRNAADLVFLRPQDFTDAQQVAQVQQVMES